MGYRNNNKKIFKLQEEKKSHILEFLESLSRIVLIEKAPFLVRIKNTTPSRIGSVYKHSNLLMTNSFLGNFPIFENTYLMVRPVTKMEWEELRPINEGPLTFELPEEYYIKSKNYIIVDYGASISLKNKPHQIGCWLVESDFEIILEEGNKKFDSLW